LYCHDRIKRFRFPNGEGIILHGEWRRERDSNPRKDYSFTGLANLRFRPLSHLSMLINQALVKVVAMNLIPIYDTAMKNETKQSSWQKTRYANLVRYVPSGTYFIRAKVNGKLIRETLETDVETVARLKLGDRLAALRNQPRITSAAKMTFGDAAAIFKADIAASRDLKPLSKEYRLHTLAAIIRTWPDVEKTEIKRLTDRDCEHWASKYADDYSPSRFNGTIQTMRAIFDVAMAKGAIASNPTAKIKQLGVKQKEMTLPTHDQFLKILEIMDKRNYLSPCSADLVRLLAFSGIRKGEAHNLSWADVDFDAGRIRVKGDPETGTKNSESRSVPMIDDLRGLLKRLHKPGATGRVIELNECRYSLETACQMAGCKKITHHDLRHLFATRCIESGVDIPTVSRWLGHQDGGKLAMKTYGHLRDDHSAEMARRVSFGKRAQKETE
jgi:integrase